VKQFGTLISYNQTRWHRPTENQCANSGEAHGLRVQRGSISRDEGL
jgi:hypothetical protein